MARQIIFRGTTGNDGTGDDLYTGAGKINDQPAARIRDIRKQGYIVATEKRDCVSCGNMTYQDYLLLCRISDAIEGELRRPLSEKLKRHIFDVLGRKDVFFDREITFKEVVIDHKFPSQRWSKLESDNELLDEEGIKSKFQLLTNQSNMLKSRMCDKCKLTGTRQGMIGFDWFYKGSQKWVGDENDNESGCVGCPWYDIQEWRKQLLTKLNFN